MTRRINLKQYEMHILEENFSTFLAYFNILLLAIIVCNIVAMSMNVENLIEDETQKNTFIPVRATSVFMWRGLEQWIFGPKTMLSEVEY